MTYHLSETDETPQLTKHIVSTDTHVAGEVCDGEFWSSQSFTYARWKVIKEGVSRPREIGRVYGHRVDESGWSAGERLAN